MCKNYYFGVFCTYKKIFRKKHSINTVMTAQSAQRKKSKIFIYSFLQYLGYITLDAIGFSSKDFLHWCILHNKVMVYASAYKSSCSRYISNAFTLRYLLKKLFSHYFQDFFLPAYFNQKI